MSRVETQNRRLPPGAEIITGVVVGQLISAEDNLISPQKLLPSGRKPEANPSAETPKPLQPQRMVNTQLRGTRPTEYHDARSFQKGVYHGPIRVNDEFGRVPDNRTQRLAKARKAQQLLEERGTPRAEARNQSRLAVGLNEPLEARLKRKRMAIRAESLHTPEVIETQSPFNSLELSNAVEEMVVNEVTPEITKYLDTLQSPQEKAMAAAFLAQLFTIGAAKLTPDAQVELIEAYHKKQAENAKVHGQDDIRIPPVRVAGLILSLGLLGSLLAGCMPDNQSQVSPDTQQATADLNDNQSPQEGTSTQSSEAAVMATPAVLDSPIAEATGTLAYRETVDAFSEQIPDDIAARMTEFNVAEIVDQYALGNPTLARELTAEAANLIHALLGDPEDLVVLQNNIELVGISYNNQHPDTLINGNHVGFKVTSGNETEKDKFPVGTLFFWSNGQKLASELSTAEARSNVLTIIPPEGGRLDRIPYTDVNTGNTLMTIVGFNSDNQVVFYLNDSNQRLDPNGELLDVAATAEAENIPPTPTPEPSTPTPQPSETPIPEITLNAGEVKYEFSVPDTSEVITIAIPEDWANILNYAATEPGQLFNNEVPIAQTRVEEQNGRRNFMYGNITIATEINGKWVPSDTVETPESYLQFTNGILAQVVDLGHIDPPQVNNPEVEITYNSQLVEDIGTINSKIIHNTMVVGAKRTNYVVIHDGKALETTEMTLELAYWTGGREIRFSVTGHYNMGLGEGPVLLSDYQPPIGEYLDRLFIIWSNNLAPQAKRESAIAGNVMWQLNGVGLLGQSPTEPPITNGTNIALPTGYLSAVVE